MKGVLVGRGVLRNPWILAQASDLAAGRAPRAVTLRIADGSCSITSTAAASERGRVDEAARRSHDRWVINKLRALASWYTKGLDNGSHLRTKINTADSLAQLRAIIMEFFCQPVTVASSASDHGPSESSNPPTSKS